MIGDFFYNLFIMPLQLIFEVIFWFLQSRPALAIIAISIVMNFLALPLYRRADAIQEAERDKVASMAYRVGRIKKTFRGDERYMMLSTYYRQQNYKPIYSLRSTFPLLLQVPFFIAAYQYLSHLTLLNGASFLFLKDLGAPDQLLSFGTFHVNLMPLIMTLINVVSAFIYLKGFPVRDKIQTYGIAAIFLVLLYNSPSGLVFYWTLNQVFSVLKNVFMKLVKSRKVLNLFFSILGLLIFAALMLSGILNTPGKTASGIILLLICQIPSFVTFRKRRGGEKKESSIVKVPKYRTFLLGGCLISVLLGIVIPMAVISSSPSEFMTGATNPFTLVLCTFCISAGFFIVWLGIYYYMASAFVKTVFSYAVWILSGVFILDYMLFSKSLGVMSTYLVFDKMPSYTGTEKLINLLAVLALCVILALVMKYFGKIVDYVYMILLLGCVVLAAISIINTSSQLRAAQQSAGKKAESIAPGEEEEGSNVSVGNIHEKIIPLSKEGKNVVVIMADRAINGYLPYLFHEKPVLKEQFAGFTYYPNTISLGAHTNISAPSLFGGYEYTPEAINSRPEQSIAEKHDEALLLMPTLFSEEGHKVTVCDPPYAGYERFGSDLTIYDHLENVSAYQTYGAYAGDLLQAFSPVIQKTQKRNFFFYSLMRTVPVFLKNTVYNGGNYYSTTTGNLSCSDEFLWSYSVLYNLPALTKITDDEKGTLLLLENDTTHSPTILKTPEYEPVPEITGDIWADPERFTLDGETITMEDEYELGHYHANMAAYLRLGDWFDYLREEGVYDNTRIIIVADHGNGMGQFEDLLITEDWDAEWVYPLLLYKDFGSTEFSVSDEFMTIADVPYMAMEGIIENMTNPFTGNKITDDVNKEEQMVTTSHYWNIDENRGNVFDLSDGTWWKVRGNVRDRNSWKRVRKHSE